MSPTRMPTRTCNRARGPLCDGPQGDPYSYEFDYDKILVQNFIRFSASCTDVHAWKNRGCSMRPCRDTRTGTSDPNVAALQIYPYPEADLRIHLSLRWQRHDQRLDAAFPRDNQSVYEKYESLIPPDSDIARKRKKALFEAYLGPPFHCRPSHASEHCRVAPLCGTEGIGCHPEQIRSTISGKMRSRPLTGTKP